MPLVTTPTSLAAGEDRVALPRDARPGEHERRQLLRRCRARAAAATASEPMKPVSSLQHQPSPASIGLRSLVRSLP